MSTATRASLETQLVKNLPAMQETQVQSLGWKDPRRRECLPTPVFLPGESHGQRSLSGYSAWGRKESDTIEWLTLSLLLSYMNYLCILDINPLSNKNLLPFGRLPFHFTDGFFCYGDIFKFDLISLHLFFPYFSCLRRHIQNDVAKTDVQDTLPVFFFFYSS